MPTITIYFHPQLLGVIAGVAVFIVIKSVIEMIP